MIFCGEILHSFPVMQLTLMCIPFIIWVSLHTHVLIYCISINCDSKKEFAICISICISVVTVSELPALLVIL